MSLSVLKEPEKLIEPQICTGDTLAIVSSILSHLLGQQQEAVSFSE